MAPRWTWRQIEAALIDIPADDFARAPSGFGRHHDGMMARARLADDLRRRLVAVNERDTTR